MFARGGGEMRLLPLEEGEQLGDRMEEVYLMGVMRTMTTKGGESRKDDSAGALRSCVTSSPFYLQNGHANYDAYSTGYGWPRSK